MLPPIAKDSSMPNKHPQINHKIIHLKQTINTFIYLVHLNLRNNKWGHCSVEHVIRTVEWIWHYNCLNLNMSF